MNFNSFFTDPNLFEKMKPLLRKEDFQKGEVIEEAGKISKRLFFIESGLIRVFYRKNGKEICCHFAREGEALTGIDSFFTGNPSIYTSEALEPTSCYSISQEGLEYVYNNVPGMDRLGREFVTAAYIDLVERYNSLVSMTSEERYHLFISRSSDLLNRVPLGYISSYLGMTQETLSRIRGKRG